MNIHIPKKIHVSWKDTDILSSDHIFARRCVQSLVKNSDGWSIEFSTDNDVDTYLKDNLDRADYLLLSECHIVEKLDVWRLIKMYNGGGIYSDIDRMCNTSINEILQPNTKCVLPTCEDDNFSQDFMCSAPGNPIYSTTIGLVLERRKAGHTNTYFLGPQTYMHGVTKVLLGEIVDVNPGAFAFEEIRKVMNEMPFMETYRETPPYDTYLFRPKFDLDDFEHEYMKRDFYRKSGIGHWTGDW